MLFNWRKNNKPKNPMINENPIECENPLCPKISEYGMPYEKAMTSMSGIIVAIIEATSKGFDMISAEVPYRAARGTKG